MTLGEVIDAYVTFHKEREAFALRGAGAIEPVPSGDGRSTHRSRLRGGGRQLSSRTRRAQRHLATKYRILSGLTAFAIGRGHVDKSPLPMATPKRLSNKPHTYIRTTSYDDCWPRCCLCTWPIAGCGSRCTARCCSCFTAAAYVSAKPYD